MLIIVGDLDFSKWSSQIELLGIILFVMLVVSICCILSVQYDSALAMVVVKLLLAKLVCC